MIKEIKLFVKNRTGDSLTRPENFFLLYKLGNNLCRIFD